MISIFESILHSNASIFGEKLHYHKTGVLIQAKYMSNIFRRLKLTIFNGPLLRDKYSPIRTTELVDRYMEKGNGLQGSKLNPRMLLDHRASGVFIPLVFYLEM